MDIRIVNTAGAIINATELSLVADGKYLIGLTSESKRILIETCKDKEEVEEIIDGIIKALQDEEVYSILVDLRGFIKKRREKESKDGKQRGE